MQQFPVLKSLYIDGFSIQSQLDAPRLEKLRTILVPRMQGSKCKSVSSSLGAMPRLEALTIGLMNPTLEVSTVSVGDSGASR